MKNIIKKIALISIPVCVGILFALLPQAQEFFSYDFKVNGYTLVTVYFLLPAIIILMAIRILRTERKPQPEPETELSYAEPVQPEQKPEPCASFDKKPW